LKEINDITIRNNLQPGDLSYIIYLHGKLYKQEYDYGTQFEVYVAEGLGDFFKNYDLKKDRIWICEHEKKIIGSLLLIHHKNNSAQLRYFLIAPQYRGLGLGKKLMQLFMDFFYECNYQSCYLWTTEELISAASLYKRFGFILSEEKISDAFGKKVKEQRYDFKIK
jgi:N-acetylglutamate synthase-like GNAT family acetyltransferase